MRIENPLILGELSEICMDRSLDRPTTRGQRLSRLELLDIFREDTRCNLGSSSLWRGVVGLFYYPGLQCVVLHRIAAWAYGKGAIAKVLGILVWRLNVFATGAYLHPSAKIGPGLRLPHPIGVVVGNGVVIGTNVTLYQNTTIGVSSRAKYDTYPVIGDGVIIYCGAVVIGGVHIGADATIGANAVVLQDVPGSATAVGMPARALRAKTPAGSS